MSGKNKEIFIRNYRDWENFLSLQKNFKQVFVQDIDFREKGIDFSGLALKNTTFFGCRLNRQQTKDLVEAGAFVYPKFEHLPYNPNRQNLYTHQELLGKFDQESEDSVDLKIYESFKETRYTPSIQDAMAQRLHDFNIDESLRRLILYDEKGMTEKKAVGFMGGHGARRGSEYYVKVAQTAKLMTENGYYIVSGGGPGIMEAANLGAYFGGKTNEELADAIEILSDLDFPVDLANPKDYLAQNYVAQAQKVLKKYPDGQENLAIPTWFYGHEPTNVFASHIAKYFSNSIREDTLLAICLYGVIFAPGSAGTTQEIFQEAAQNHYGTFGYISPMVFLGKSRYVEETSLYSVLHQLAVGKKYKKLLYLADEPALVLEFIENHPPQPVEDGLDYIHEL